MTMFRAISALSCILAYFSLAVAHGAGPTPAPYVRPSQMKFKPLPRPSQLPKRKRGIKIERATPKPDKSAKPSAKPKT